ncbi:glycoside hydrolase family 3 C-terminal domain-containing protein [Streptomyces sp. B8F3]|uniref:beta-glucosidase family protein n=1 Tax=unclassified Streptomyces TaxID=2593676 RepID=UPI00325DB2BE
MTDTTASEPATAALRDLVGKLTLEQKVRLLTGADNWALHAEPAVGLRRIVLSDGPSGVRGESWDGRFTALNLPSATALAASWDLRLAYRYGAIIAHEARRMGVDVVLGPTINLHRSPLGGRHFEAYSEDPLLTSRLAAAFVRGVQGGGVGATPKHYVANDAETDRLTVDNRIGERALRELYLAAFEDTVVDERPWMVMSAYNSVNGTTMTEHPLLAEPLCGEWGFDGVVVSDWWAVRSTAPAALARQDLVMPGPDGPWGDKLTAAVREGRVPEETVDEKVLRILRLAARVGALEGFVPAVPEPPAAEDGPALAREVAAAGTVLVRNSGELPWPAGGLRSLAVIGHLALQPRTQGGGSATVEPSRAVSPMEGLRAALPDTSVTWHLGALAQRGIAPFAGGDLTDPVSGRPGARLVCRGADGAAILDEHRRDTNLARLGSARLGATATVEVTTRYLPDRSGPVRIGVAGAGTLRLLVDGTELLRELVHTGEEFGGGLVAPPHASVPVELVAGEPVDIAVRLDLPPRQGPDSGVTLVAGLDLDTGTPDAEIAAAAAAARDADAALVVVGTGPEVESEGFDRTSLALPGRQDDLVRAVAAANTRTVVAVNAGAPVLLPWRNDVAAVLLTWFGGQEFGHALADVLLGTVEPGGRLPTTWPADEADVPVLSTTPEAGRLPYDESIRIGHRAWLESGAVPAYPFGHGLGYTTWTPPAARIPGELAPGDDLLLTVGLRNTGQRRGKQVVQAYLSRPDSAVDRPALWLAGHATVTAGPGEAVTAALTIPARAFQHWDGAWRTEPGDYLVHLGFSSADPVVTETVRIR